MAAGGERGRRLGAWRLVAAAVSLALLVLFVGENFALVEVRLIIWETRMRLAWALLLASGPGFLAGFFLARRR